MRGPAMGASVAALPFDAGGFAGDIIAMRPRLT
jgi:hypothetical protein